MEPWNTKYEMDFDVFHGKEIKKYYDKITSVPKVHRNKQKKLIEKPTESVEYLKEKYDEGYGLKLLGRALDLSYMRMRSLFDYFDLEMRKGRAVCTDITKKIRSERVQGEKNPWFDWTARHPQMHIKNSRGIQGFYKMKTGKYIWLRSTWEYIYAKWLDSKNIKWEFEGTQYKLSNGEQYRPDFSILDNNDNIKYIVEIKGYYKNRVYKVDLFRQDYDIPIILIYSIEDYCISYSKELRQWKQSRLTQKELLEKK